MVEFEKIAEFTIKSLSYFSVVYMMYRAFLAGEDGGIYDENKNETIESFNQKFYPTDEDWQRFEKEFEGKEWAKSTKVKYIVASKKCELGLADIDDMAFLKRLSPSKKPKPEPQIKYKTAKEPEPPLTKPQIIALKAEIEKKQIVKSLRPRRTGDREIYLKEREKNVFEL